MKIAAIYWGTSSVGGINTELRNWSRAAKAAGDTLDVIYCPNSTKQDYMYKESKLIRGGDTFITIDGRISHSPRWVEDSCKWLEDNYDGLFFAFPCPHATKAYGSDPLFTGIYDGTDLPKVVRVTDGYWDTYADWGAVAAERSGLLTVAQEAYAIPLRADPNLSTPIKVHRLPFYPGEPGKMKRSPTPLLVWPNQWKDIKGIKPFLTQVPGIDKRWEIDLYSNGIRYYQLRTEEIWNAAVGLDKFAGFNGKGNATFHGYVSLEEIRNVFSKAWAMVDLQGMGRPKYKHYAQGSYNNTTVEALYYGTWPILHEQVLASGIPPALIKTVKSADEIPALLKTLKPKTPREITAAKDWVMETHYAGKSWAAFRRVWK